jgi:hypothetical protein
VPRGTPPDPRPADGVDEQLQARLDLALADQLQRLLAETVALGRRRRHGHAGRLEQVGGEIPAGVAQHQRTQAPGRLQRQAQADIAAARMPQQVDRLALHVDQREQVLDMLRGSEVRALAIPALRIIMSKTGRQQTIALAQTAQLPLPVAVIAKRAVHQYQRHPLPFHQAGQFMSIE